MTSIQRSDQVAAKRASIGLVWRPQEITPAVLQMSRQTGSRAIFDFSALSLDAITSYLKKSDPGRGVRDIKISLAAFLDPCLATFLEESGVCGLWVECGSPFFPKDPALFLQRLKELSRDHRIFPVTGDLEILAAILKDGAGAIVLKGCEASGFVGADTATSLYAMAKKICSEAKTSLDILIWGGVATPEAAAAFLSTGAAGIVFESLHWLTDLVVVDDAQRQRLSRLRLDATGLIGLNLLRPCRLFNKGNSRAFREMVALENSLLGKEITGESRRLFADRVQARALHPLESSFGPDEVIFLGVEAAFAASFRERFGAATAEAVRAFMDEIREQCAGAEAKKMSFLESPTARELGTRYPVIQGAMSWITDVPEFALEVADAGGLPTIALGLMDAPTLDLRLGSLPEIMGERPYAINVVSLAENPFGKTHLEWIKRLKPRFVTIAGGDLSPVRELTACGIGVIFIAPDEALLRLALEAGVRYVVCEGYEAGGHVGEHSTLTLAQMVLELKRRTPALFHDCRLILAGGIFNRETAFMAAMLGADAVQLGTAYLATREIVATGALTELYQRMILTAIPGKSVVSGQETGLRVRSLRTPRVEAILSAEREFAAGHKDECSFRAKMEGMAAGGLFIAARGLDRPGGNPLDEAGCLARGHFMSGALAGLIGAVRPLASLHRELVEGPIVLNRDLLGENAADAKTLAAAFFAEDAGSVGAGPGARRGDSLGYESQRIAITGMSMLNALGNSPEEIWQASLDMKSGVTLIPLSRWDHGLFYDPRPRVSEKTYCNVGAFLDFPVSRTELGIPPQDFRSMTDATKYTLWLADRAIRSSGILESDLPRERIGVIISQNSGEAAGTLTDIIIRAYAHDIMSAVQRAVNLTPDQLRAVEKEVKAGRTAPDDTTLLGRLNCAAPGFVCNRYGFMGPSFAVSAACATSLVALHSALQMIRNGVIDAAIVGGAEEHLTHLHYLEFSALGALYGMSGRLRDPREASSPFDAERDGLVLGEGGGMIVIERECVARARGATVHAVITGMGASNSNLGMVESASSVQELAIRASFEGLPYGPEAVELVECHATSTRQGDVEEVRALKSFYGPSKRTVLTSFKSQIGHTLGASGINNLIRGTMALKTGIFPATLNYRHPDPELGVEGSGLLVAPEPLDWKGRDGEPRRLQVNAFGFGGSNYVVQVEQSREESDTVLVSPGGVFSPVAPMKASPPTTGISFFRTTLEGQTFRMAVVAGSDTKARAVVNGAAPLFAGGTGSKRALRELAQQGIFLSREELPVPPLALVFPGQGSQYCGMGRELYESFPVIREWVDRAAAVAEFDLVKLLFHDKENNLIKTRWQQPAMFALEHALARHLVSLGIRPVALAGHSLGELTALCLAGVFSAEDGFGIVNKRALCMDQAAATSVEPGIMAAVDAPLELLEEAIRGRDGVYIGNINSPRQVVICGNTEPVGALVKSLKEKGYRATLLRVSMAFHSPIMKVIHRELKEYLATISIHSPRMPVISNTTRAPYPSDPDAIRGILMAHLESPVHWMDNVRTLWDDFGVRLFVEVGPGEPLSNLIADTCPESTCLTTCLPEAEALTFRTALARLFVLGHLKVAAEPAFIALPDHGKTLEPRLHPFSGEVPQASPASPAHFSPAEQIAQREINRFVMENFGGVLTPKILGAVRQELNPAFPEGELSALWNSRFPGLQPTKCEEPVASAKDAPAPSLSAEPLALGAAASPEGEVTESLIRIIMEATGFDRDEIRPEMDLRKDLSIRSSRLPIIMDAAERHFGITIELEEFIDARSVTDIAQRIFALVQAKDGPPKPEGGSGSTESPPEGVEAPSLQPGAANERRDLMESLIGIIMDATGFDRDEIRPEMDLRKDLSIRSSRLPIIMDAVEREFAITIEMEDFIGARTVAEIAQGIAAVIAGKRGGNLEPETKEVPHGELKKETPDLPQASAGLKRLIFRDVALPPPVTARPVDLSPGDTVVILSPDSKDVSAKKAGEIFRRDHGADTLLMQILPGNPDAREGFDLLTDAGAARLAKGISGTASPAGLLISLPEGWSGRLGMADIAKLLKGLLLLLQAFLASPKKKFLFLVHAREDGANNGRLFAEGVLGLFLSAAQEYASVQFRTLEIERGTDLRAALRAALDRGCAVVELKHRDGLVVTPQGELAPSVLGEGPGLVLGEKDVIVMSGGATGISAHLAQSLAPFHPRLVFLGRTRLDPWFASARPAPGRKTSAAPGSDRAAEIAVTLAQLHSLGIEATYLPCDVTDPEAVRAVLGEVAGRYGRIDGIVHGAGVLSDGLLGQMTPEDLARVVEVKFLGAWNLFSAAASAGLKFFVGLSSAAAIQGNPGQANYAAANRMMSGFLDILHGENGALRCKALMLPPVEGAGMAGDPELRELLKLKGVAYIHANELAGLFCRELLAPSDDVRVMFMRSLPTLGTALINDAPPVAPAGQMEGGTVSLNPEEFPMIGRITSLDLRREELEAFRTFSPEKDLWISDHRPLSFLKHPLVSAAMMLETFMEASRIVYPHLRVRGVREVRLKEMLSCPPGVPRPSRISCRRSGNGLKEVWCEVCLATQDISPAGRLTDRFTEHCTGQVILDGGRGDLGEGGAEFPVRLDELRTGPVDHQQLVRWYRDRSALCGRYRVLESLDGVGPGVVRGRTICRQTQDFAALPGARYQYSPYLFEALLQLVGFQVAQTDPAQSRAVIPVEIGELKFSRLCRDGEPISLEARLRKGDHAGLAWDARGIDADGRAVMQVKNMRMEWVSP